MKENVLTYVNKLEGYKTAIKNLHWSSKNMSEHKLFDDIAESVASIQDEVAEMEQGMHGQIEKNKLKPTAYTIESNQKFLDDMLDATKEFHKSISGEEYIGIRSSVESFIGELNKFKYLMDLCLKEDLQRRIKGSVNEEKTFTITEGQLNKMVLEAVDDYYSEMVDGARKEKMIKDKVKEGLMKAGFTGFWGEKDLSFCVSINEIDDVSIIERIAVRESQPKSYNDCRVELLPSGFGCMVIIPAWTHSNLFN